MVDDDLLPTDSLFIRLQVWDILCGNRSAVLRASFHHETSRAHDYLPLMTTFLLPSTYIPPPPDLIHFPGSFAIFPLFPAAYMIPNRVGMTVVSYKTTTVGVHTTNRSLRSLDFKPRKLFILVYILFGVYIPVCADF